MVIEWLSFSNVGPLKWCPIYTENLEGFGSSSFLKRWHHLTRDKKEMPPMELQPLFNILKLTQYYCDHFVVATRNNLHFYHTVFKALMHLFNFIIIVIIWSQKRLNIFSIIFQINQLKYRFNFLAWQPSFHRPLYPSLLETFLCKIPQKYLEQKPVTNLFPNKHFTYFSNYLLRTIYIFIINIFYK